ncbi:hypothetical protein [Polaribacter sp. Hel_I_88]|uniref:hypothetical protein n=1 Tax=Polaribacter sp. Hel_I_88 TaxID=1250006 RepID=UPI00047E5476|nr:hypothetical protein [Polaribacter sp. Hel_I_88]
MTFPKEFKEALSHLPSTEKDKLILRLLKKDLVLANRLLFELVNTNTVEEQRDKVEKTLLDQIRRSAENGHYSIGYLNFDVRDLSGFITEHVKITKDKFGEAHLNLIMINEVLKINRTFILNSKPPAKTKKFCIAVIARAFKIVMIVQKLDDDFLIEFESNLKKLGALIIDNKFLMKEAIRNGFDVNWLLNAEIPEDISTIHKQIRAAGFLKYQKVRYL